MKYYIRSLIILLITMLCITLRAEKTKPQALIPPKVLGIAQGALSAICLAQIANIGYFAYKHDELWEDLKSKSSEGPSHGMGRIALAFCGISMASLLHSSYDLGYAAFKSVSAKPKDDSEKSSLDNLKEDAVAAPQHQAEKNDALLGTVKAQHFAAGIGKWALAGGAAAMGYLTYAGLRIAMREFCPKRAVVAKFDQSDRIRAFFFYDFFKFSLVGAASSWAYILYKFGRSGKDSFKTAILEPEELAEENRADMQGV